MRAELLRARLVLGGCAAAHLLLVALLGSPRVEHVIVDLLIAAVPWLGRAGHDFTRTAFPLWVTGVIIDNQRLWLAHAGEVHVGDLHAFELRLFPAPGGVTWPEWFVDRTHPVLDLVCGIPYATYIFQYLGVAAILYFIRRERCLQATWIFLVANCVAAAIYFLYPAAPPWYVIAHGLGPVDPMALPSAAGGLRFDALVGIDWFATLYARGPNTFGAMPSMHAAYPLVIVLLTWDLGRRWRVATVAYTAAMWLGAVYLHHHYIVDILAGIAIAVGATWLVRAALAPRAAGDRWATWPNVVTGLRTVIGVVVFAAAAAQASPLLNLVGLGLLWLLDVADGALARWLGQETRLGARLDMLADRLLIGFFYVNHVRFHPDDLVPAVLFLFQFVVLDYWLFGRFMHWPVRSRVRFHEVTSGLATALLVLTSLQTLTIAVVVATIGVKVYSIARLQTLPEPEPSLGDPSP